MPNLQPEVPKVFVSPAQAQGVLSVSKATMKRLLRRGELESILIGRSRGISVASLNAFAERYRV